MKASSLAPAAIARRIGRELQGLLRRWARCPSPCQFRPARSIDSQSISFRFGSRALTVAAGYNTPLYDTIAEVVDYDCYRLRDIDQAALAGTTLVDIGANVGVTALCLAQVPGIRGLVCFEPLPENRSWLEVNFRRNECQGVVLRPEAITDTNGTATFWVPDDESVGGRVVDAGTVGRSIAVQTCDLKTALADLGPIGLMKIDCEGGEYSIMKQFTPDLVSRIRNVTMEVHYRDDATQNLGWLVTRFSSLGYRIQLRPDAGGRESLHHLLACR